MINDRLRRFADSFSVFVRTPPNAFASTDLTTGDQEGTRSSYLPTCWKYGFRNSSKFA